MRSTLRTALLAALPIEIVNFWIVGYPATGHIQNAGIALQWYVLHLPALIAADRIQFLRQHAFASSIAFLLAGYLDTAILLAAIIGAVKLVLRTLRKLSSPIKQVD